MIPFNSMDQNNNTSAPFNNYTTIATLQRPPSFTSSSSRSRSRGQPTPQYPPNGLDTSSNSDIVTPPELTRDPAYDGVANLNRWSRSTSSSRDPNSAQRSSSRRLSFGAHGGFNFGSPEQQRSSPRRLQKSRQSTGESPGSQLPAARLFESPTKPPTKPSLNLPSLQIPVQSSSSPLTGSPSTAGLLSAAVRTAGSEYFSHWEATPRDFSQKKPPSRSRSESLNPALPTRTTVYGEEKGREGGDDTTTLRRGHSRSQSGKSSGSSRTSKQPSQKAMLSKALQKANTAVLLDNAQNFEGATQAYSEACALLQQVMLRSSGDEDRRKLEAIRNTYTSRISELKKISPPLRDDNRKALPARPASGTFMSSGIQSADEDDEPVAVIETATVTRIVNDQSYSPGEYSQSRAIPASQVPRRRESLLPTSLEPSQYRSRKPQDPIERSYSKSPMQERNVEVANFSLSPPMESLYMPPPLSPRRPLSPMTLGRSGSVNQERKPSGDLAPENFSRQSPAKGHIRIPSNESMSWLDTIDESGGSSRASSVHSRTSSMGVRRKRIRAASGATEAEFDAALDAAVEAAYDDGFEPMDDPDPTTHDYENDDEIVASVRRRVELAKERVRQSEREVAIQDAREQDRKRRLLEQELGSTENFDDIYGGNESDEEERMLEEMTRGYIMDDFEFGLQSKSALPRESDSSGFSGRTWHSSIGSNPTTAGTTLSTVTETSTMPQLPLLLSKGPPLGPPPSLPPPTEALPPPPPMSINNQLSGTIPQGVRSRRLSGQNAKQLKIETSKIAPAGPLTQPPAMPPPRIPGSNDPVQPKTAGLPRLRETLQGMTSSQPMPQSARQMPSSFGQASTTEVASPPTPTLSKTFTNEAETNEMPRSASPGRAPSRSGITTNFSSSSLKNMKSRNLSVSNMDDSSERSPGTPLSSQSASRDLNGNGRLPAMPTLPTPIATAFRDKLGGVTNGGLYLFDSDIHSPDSPGSPNLQSDGAPIPLEPCPTEFLLRPFWLMRALYQTIAHPKGGYLSTKLFVPRDVWRVKGVKIKNVEDKIANCDFLTAALLKLATVDTFDADAVLEEMQALEGVLDQVQQVLAKKLGSEVGSQGSGGMFSAPGELDSGATSKSSTSSKSSAFSWRRLRSKNSGVGLANNFSNKASSGEAQKEGLVMGTLPMTSTSTSKTRFAKRDVSQVQFSGPNANYMSALARLFDAAQALDQIARQVEDPGLRHADKTQVGLELCTRHAAEFFGFYICRFVLTDIAILLDKFIKRGSEWVLV